MALSKEVFDRIQNIFRVVFDDTSIEISDATQATDIEGYDSLNHVTLVMAIEEELDVRFTTQEVMGFQDVGEMLQCVDGKLAAKG